MCVIQATKPVHLAYASRLKRIMNNMQKRKNSIYRSVMQVISSKSTSYV